jgi:hypothetical protein
LIADTGTCNSLIQAVRSVRSSSSSTGIRTRYSQKFPRSRLDRMDI